MKIALMDLNDMQLNGETHFSIHARAGFVKLGHECDIISMNHFGRPKKRSEKTDFGIKWLRYKNVSDIVGLYDMYMIFSGKFKTKDYMFLAPLARMKNVIKTILIHGGTQFKSYNLKELLDIIEFDAIYNVDEKAIDFYNEYAPTSLVELPFDQSMMKPASGIKNREIIVPTRFTFCKYADKSMEIIDGLARKGYIKKADFYGDKDEVQFVSNIRKFSEEFERHLRLGLMQLNGIYYFKDKQDVYSSREFLLDTTRIKNAGPKRMQYTFFDAMFYKIVPVTHDFWHHGYFISLRPSVDEIINCIENPNMRRRIIESNTENLEHYKAENIMKEYLKF